MRLNTVLKDSPVFTGQHLTRSLALMETGKYVTNMFEGMTDYRQVLKSQFALRKERNPRYSLRAFARDLGLPQTRLSDILRGKYGISAVMAASIAARFGFTQKETEVFVLMVESRHARSRLGRETARAKLSELGRANDQRVSVDQFKVLSNWFHFAILELTRLDGFENSPRWIARRLGISIAEADGALKRLVSSGLLRAEAGKLVPSGGFVATPTDIASEAVKAYHEQILKKAQAAVRVQSVAERDLSCMNLLLSSDQIPEAKEMIRRFRRSFVDHFEGKGARDKLYALSLQLFRLDTDATFKETQDD